MEKDFMTPYQVLQIAQKGDFAGALEAVKKIPWPYWRCHTLKDIALLAGKARLGVARRALEMIEAEFPNLEGDYWRAIMSRDIGIIKVSLGLVGEAVKHFDTAVQFVDKLDDVSVKIGTLREIGREVAKEKDKSAEIERRARQIFRKALIHAEALEDNESAAHHLADTAIEMAQAGFQAEAISPFMRAVGLARKIENLDSKFGIMNKVVEGMLKGGLVSDAMEVVGLVQAEARKIEDVWEKSRRLSELGEILVKTARQDTANAPTIRAKLDEVLVETEERWWKSKIAAEVAVLDYETGNLESAYQLLQSVAYQELRPQIADRIEADYIDALKATDVTPIKGVTGGSAPTAPSGGQTGGRLVEL